MKKLFIFLLLFQFLAISIASASDMQHGTTRQIPSACSVKCEEVCIGINDGPALFKDQRDVRCLFYDHMDGNKNTINSSRPPVRANNYYLMAIIPALLGVQSTAKKYD